MKVFWTETAVNHLSSIYNYISQNSPQYAQRLVEKLTRRSEQIANFPFSGRLVPEFETEQIREVIEGSYRIIYYIKPEQIDVIAVLHAARNIENPQD
ncbi:type II toxin-antitoxin system RelE/ParE family toxin [Microcystis sp. LEGE 08355]|uniref:type II toxin-antitoxin system RelE/ParE family toxin n=1 Tax=Microcystis sp. LEGE 08355 TaxID=1828687 RepID=UPI0018810562|nr:type II toxin-antitoxin system RelE/ParE family toxin [Microcystis sp. LEGE 08355]MBE9073683.1 type II toxin-antitoxin system RelE/ParE family toxin [Microcystis sp. LEGE 08355]